MWRWCIHSSLVHSTSVICCMSAVNQAPGTEPWIKQETALPSRKVYMLSRQANIKQMSVEYNEVVTKDLEKQKAGRGQSHRGAKSAPLGRHLWGAGIGARTSWRTGAPWPYLGRRVPGGLGGRRAVARLQGGWGCPLGWSGDREGESALRPDHGGLVTASRGVWHVLEEAGSDLHFTRWFWLPLGHRSGGAWMAREDLSRPAGSHSLGRCRVRAAWGEQGPARGREGATPGPGGEGRDDKSRWRTGCGVGHKERSLRGCRVLGLSNWANEGRLLMWGKTVSSVMVMLILRCPPDIW